MAQGKQLKLGKFHITRALLDNTGDWNALVMVGRRLGREHKACSFSVSGRGIDNTLWMRFPVQYGKFPHIRPQDKLFLGTVKAQAKRYLKELKPYLP